MKLITTKEFMGIAHISRSTIFRYRKNDPRFPRPVRLLGDGGLRWDREEVYRWIAFHRDA